MRHPRLQTKLLHKIFVVAVAFLIQPLPARAADVTWNSCVANMGTGATDIATLQCLEPVFSRIISIATGLSLLAFFIMFVIAAFKYLTSGGDPKQTESARNTMTYAVIGIVVIISSFVILRFISIFTGRDILTFTIPKP